MMKIIVYALTALLLIVGGFAAVQFGINQVRKERVENLTTKLHNAEQAFESISEAATATGVASAELAVKLQEIDVKGSVITERVTIMERSNEKIRDILSTPLPDNGCLLDDSCDAPIRWSGGGLAGTVPEAAGVQVGDRPRPGNQ